MDLFGWLFWFLLPGDGAGLGWRRERLNGTSEINETVGFSWAVRGAIGLIGIALALLGPVFRVPGLADHPVAVAACSFVVVLLVWTILPGVSSVRAHRAARDNRQPGTKQRFVDQRREHTEKRRRRRGSD